MSIELLINGQSFFYPETNDVQWGGEATDWAIAVTSGMLQKQGGLFQLLAEVDFGTTFGIKSAYYKSRTANVAAAGQVRLAVSDIVQWRNNANDNDLPLGVNASDELTWDGVPVQIGSITVSDTATIDLTLLADNISADIKALSIDNSYISNSAAIAYSKLALTNSILNADINSAAAIAYSKLALSNSIVNADINSAAAIAYSKLALTGAIVNADISASAAIAYSKLSLSNSIVNADINSSAAIAYSKLALTGSIVNADINASAAIAYSKLALTGSILNADISATAAIAFTKLATLSSGNILVGNGSNAAASVAVTGDVTISNAGVTAIGANKVTNAMLAQIATATFKGRTTASTGNVEDLTATQATALLNALVGDSGSGGTKGLAPAPAAGDAAAGKFLKADGTWVAPAGAGDVVGPASSTDGGFAKFDGTTGKLLKNSAARVAFTDLAALSSANILVGNGSSNAVGVAVTGDIALTNAGVTSYSGTVPLNKGGTGQTAKAAAFDALSPMSAGGDLIYGGASGTGTRLANGTAGQYLKSSGTTVAPAWQSFTMPTQTRFTTGTSQTYSTPAGVLYLKVRLIGGGGGGSGGGSAGGTAAGDGGATSFTDGTVTLTGNGGAHGVWDANPPTGGTASISGGTAFGTAFAGGKGSGGGGGGGGGANASNGGGTGASTPFSGGGGGGKGDSAAGGTGQAPTANSGAGGGGGGAGAAANSFSGTGGAAGGYVEAFIPTPAASYTYSVGGVGSAGGAGTNGSAGGAGAAGYIEITEFYT